MDRNLQRCLRNSQRNKCVLKFANDTENHRMLFESEDIVLVCKMPKDKADLSIMHWFPRHKNELLLNEERAMVAFLRQQAKPRDWIPRRLNDQLLVVDRKLQALMAAVRFYMG